MKPTILASVSALAGAALTGGVLALTGVAGAAGPPMPSPVLGQVLSVNLAQAAHAVCAGESAADRADVASNLSHGPQPEGGWAAAKADWGVDFASWMAGGPARTMSPACGTPGMAAPPVSGPGVHR